MKFLSNKFKFVYSLVVVEQARERPLLIKAISLLRIPNANQLLLSLQMIVDLVQVILQVGTSKLVVVDFCVVFVALQEFFVACQSFLSLLVVFGSSCFLFDYVKPL